jgi:hypothetical protein
MDPKLRQQAAAGGFDPKAFASWAMRRKVAGDPPETAESVDEWLARDTSKDGMPPEALEGLGVTLDEKPAQVDYAKIPVVRRHLEPNWESGWVDEIEPHRTLGSTRYSRQLTAAEKASGKAVFEDDPPVATRPVSRGRRPPRVPTQQERAEAALASWIQDFASQPPVPVEPPVQRPRPGPSVDLPEDVNPTTRRR